VNIQRRLARAGYYHGRIDGVMGPRTREAMRAYQQSHNRRVGAASGENRGQKSDVTSQRKTTAWGS
jgi:peptidoglycan hydrolase-like protein with peptidoglycan-binding domain